MLKSFKITNTDYIRKIPFFYLFLKFTSLKIHFKSIEILRKTKIFNSFLQALNISVKTSTTYTEFIQRNTKAYKRGRNNEQFNNLLFSKRNSVFIFENSFSK